MNMFETFLYSIPKNRSEIVEDLEIPEITLSPYAWTEPEDSLSEGSDSFVTDSMGLGECDRGSISTASSIPLSRAMTDSEIDYGLYKRYKRCNFSDPWDHMRSAMYVFPAEYVASLNSFISTDTEEEIEDTYDAELAESRRRYSEELGAKMERFFDEECCVYMPDDPSLLELQDAIRSLDMKALDRDLASIRPQP